MNSLIQNVQRYLGRTLSNESADFYSVLGLQIYEEDPTKLKAALKQAASLWNAADTKSEPESAQQVAKLIRQAQSVLLSPEKKARYDQQLRELRHLVCLPAGDPTLPFDPMAWLNTQGADAEIADTCAPILLESVEVRREALQRLFPGLKDRLSISLPAMPDPRTEFREEPSVQQVYETPGPTSNDSNENMRVRFDQIKRIRVARQRNYTLGLLGAALLFLAFAGFRFWQNQQQNAHNIAQAQSKSEQQEPSSQSPRANRERPNRTTKPPTESQLRIIPPPETDLESRTENSMDDRSIVAPAMPMDDAPMAAPVTEPNMNVPAVSMEPMVTKPEVAMTTKPVEGTTPSPTQPETTPAPAEPPMAPSAEWKEAMKKGKEAILKADFKAFQTQIERALPLSKSPEMEAKHARLDQAGQLYEIFVKSVQEGRTKTRGTDVIVVGKNKVNIVEVKEDVLIVRIQGKNERHPWDKLPLGIALGLAELTLSDSDPTDIAARAIYFSFSPNRNELTDKRAKEWFKKTVGKGQIRADLEQVFADTYE